MTSPFRSDLEVLQEQVRRAEDKARDAESKADVLEREKKFLQNELARGRRPVTWTAGGIVTLSFIGVGLIFLMTRVEVSKAKAVSEMTHARCEAELQIAHELHEQVATNLDVCRKDLAVCKGDTYAPAPPTSPINAACNCEPGDPLCSCLDPSHGAPFNRGDAIASLGRADALLAQCIKPPRTVNYHVTVTFAPNGRLSSAIVDSDSSNSLTSVEKQCITDRMKASVSVPPFGGAPVRVGKSYSAGGPL